MLIFGIDEAGRGALCGPVAATCVSFYSSNFSSYSILQDSKKISAIQRKNASLCIKETAHWGHGWAYPHEIDTLNIHHATLLAMKRAYMHCIARIGNMIKSHRISSNILAIPQKVLIDGKFCPSIPTSCEAIVKGDNKIDEIKAASILAKVARDEVMVLLHQVYPEYICNIHKGYPTKLHKQAIHHYGISPIHRRSFKVH